MVRPIPPPPDATRAVLVWDLPTRLFHWLVAVLVGTAYVSWRLNRMTTHAHAGEALLGLLLFRLAWGFLGSDTARFSRFVAGPREVARHVRRLFRREPDTQIGHNPAGGWMVLLLLALLLGETLTGIVLNNDIADEGPLSEMMPAGLANLITDLHTLLWEALLAAITLHVAAIALYAGAKGHRLLWPMLTGRKRLPEHAGSPRLAPSALALLVLAGGAAAAALLATFL